MHAYIHTYIHTYMHAYTHTYGPGKAIIVEDGSKGFLHIQTPPRLPVVRHLCHKTPRSRSSGQQLRNPCLIHPLEWVAVQVAAKARPVTGD